MQREQELDGGPAADDVLEKDKMSERRRPRERERVMKNYLHYVKGGEQVVHWNTWSLSMQPVINSPAGLFESTAKYFSDSGVP